MKDTWTKTRAGGNRGWRWGWLGWWGGVGVKGRKLYLNNNKIQKYLIKNYLILASEIHTKVSIVVDCLHLLCNFIP